MPLTLPLLSFGAASIVLGIQFIHVSNSTKFAPTKNLKEVEEKRLKVVSKEFYVDLHHWLIFHGHYVCTARKPKCGACIIEDLCEFKYKTE